MGSFSKTQIAAIFCAVVLIVLLFFAPKRSVEQRALAAGSDFKVNLAISYVQDRSQPMEGIKMLKEVIEKEPDNLKALSHLGAFSVQSGQYEKAKERFNRVLELDSDYQDAHYYLGQVYLNLGEREKALESFERLKALSDDANIIKEAEKYIKELKSI